MFEWSQPPGVSFTHLQAVALNDVVPLGTRYAGTPQTDKLTIVHDVSGGGIGNGGLGSLVFTVPSGVGQTKLQPPTTNEAEGLIS